MRPLLPSLLAAVLAASCAAPRAVAPPPAAPSASEPRALLWEVTRAGAPDRPLYLTGSIHVGQPDQFVFPPSVDAAFARAGVLVVELDPEGVDPAQAQQLILQLAIAPPPAPGLSATISAETLALLPPALARVGLTAPGVEVLRPWFAAMTLSVLELQKAGYSEKGGIDLQFLKRARGQKAVLELETMESQLRVFADQPADVQDLMLREAIHNAPLTAVQLATMATAWEGGNADALADQVFTGKQDPPHAAMYEALFFARNRTIAAKLAALLEKPEIHFVVVGAGHTVGPRGIPALLAQQGFQVRQLPRTAP